MSPKLSRRNFLKISAVSAASGILTGCANPRRWVTLEPFVRPPEDQVAGQATWYASTCRQCPAGCGIIVRVMNGRALKIEGNPEHPLNKGKLCPRGHSALQVLYNPDRLDGPVTQAKRGTRQFQAVAWDAAISTLAGKLADAGSGVAVLTDSTTSGHLVDLFQRLTGALGGQPPVVFDLYTEMQGYPVLQASSAATLGGDDLPSYNIADADVVFSFGADILGTFNSTTRYGIDYGGFRSQPLGKRGYLVQFEPRMTNTGVKSDAWLPVRPGTEALVAQAIARLIADRALGPAERVGRAGALAAQVDINQAAQAADIPVTTLSQLAGIFASATRPVAIPGPDLAGQADGGAAMTAIQILNLIGGEGGQAGGVSVSAPLPVPGFVKPKVSAFGDVTGLIDKMNAGQIKVLLVYGTNPLYYLPPQYGFDKALANVPTVVSFAPIVDETAVWADMILPDRTELEAWGYEVVSPNFGQPVIGSQQPVVQPVFDTRATGDVILAAAKAIPAAAKTFTWTDEVAFLKETIGALPPGATGGSGPEIIWARFLQHGGWWPATPATPPSPAAPNVTAPAPATPQYQGSEADFPYFLRIFNPVLLSDGRGASQPWLQGVPDPITTLCWQSWVEIHPETAAKLGMDFGDVARITSPYGAVELPVYTHPGIRPDTVAVPTGQGHSEYGRYARDRGVNPMVLVGKQPPSDGGGMVWSNLRVKVEKTGKKVKLALFENKFGASEGFPNQAFPGNV